MFESGLFAQFLFKTDLLHNFFDNGVFAHFALSALVNLWRFSTVWWLTSLWALSLHLSCHYLHLHVLSLFTACLGNFWSSFFNFLNFTVWLRITDEGLVPEMRIWSILSIKSDLKWCIHLSRSLFLYCNKNWKCNPLGESSEAPQAFSRRQRGVTTRRKTKKGKRETKTFKNTFFFYFFSFLCFFLFGGKGKLCTLHFFYNKLCMTKQYTRITLAQMKSVRTKLHVCTRKSLCHVFNRTIGGARPSTRCWDIGIRRRSGEFLSWLHVVCRSRARSRTCAGRRSRRGSARIRRSILPGVAWTWLLCPTENLWWRCPRSVLCRPIVSFPARWCVMCIPSFEVDSNRSRGVFSGSNCIPSCRRFLRVPVGWGWWPWVYWKKEKTF